MHARRNNKKNKKEGRSLLDRFPVLEFADLVDGIVDVLDDAVGSSELRAEGQVAVSVIELFALAKLAARLVRVATVGRLVDARAHQD